MGKPISKSKNKGLAKMAKTAKGKEAVRKMGFNPDRMVAKKGGRAMYSKGGSADFPPVENHAQIKGFGAVRPEVKTFGKGKK